MKHNIVPKLAMLVICAGTAACVATSNVPKKIFASSGPGVAIIVDASKPDPTLRVRSANQLNGEIMDRTYSLIFKQHGDYEIRSANNACGVATMHMSGELLNLRYAGRLHLLGETDAASLNAALASVDQFAAIYKLNRGRKAPGTLAYSFYPICNSHAE